MARWWQKGRVLDSTILEGCHNVETIYDSDIEGKDTGARDASNQRNDQS